jgi:hypothetical protein
MLNNIIKAKPSKLHISTNIILHNYSKKNGSVFSLHNKKYKSITNENKIKSLMVHKNEITSPVIHENELTSPIIHENEVTSPVIHENEVISPLVDENEVISIINPITNDYRLFCNNHITYIKNIELPEIKSTTLYEAVLIEFRILPHLEFLIRNTILKLNSDWCHTVICGNLNYNYMSSLCNSISPHINVIQLNYNTITSSIYNLLLTDIHFWNNFRGNKILLYQENSILFKNNINDFLDYDYVSFPVIIQPEIINDIGIFSLRTKQVMINALQKENIQDTLNVFICNYKINANVDECPEHIYFSTIIQEYNLGKVANWNNSSEFCTERILNENSFGGYNFWLSDTNWKYRLYTLLKKD